MIRLALALLVALSLPLAARTQAPPPEVADALTAPRLHGTATTRAWGLKLYDAELWTDRGEAFDRADRFALSLTCGWNFSRETLARSTVDEIVRVEGGRREDHAALEAQLLRCLPDVRPGVRVTALAESASRVAIFVQGRRACTLSYPDLRKRFFGIWLAPTSRDTRAAARLTGQR